MLRQILQRGVIPLTNGTVTKQQPKKVGSMISFVGGSALGMTLGGSTALFKRFSTQAEAAKPLSSQTLTLYQYQVCPFCNKAQTFLEYTRVPHKRVEVNPLSKKEMKFSEYKMVPFMVVENTVTGEKTQVNGSDEIVDFVVASGLSEHKFKEDTESEKKWRVWTNDHLVHLLPPNIYQTPGEALQAFDYIANSSNFSFVERVSAKYTGALAMYFIAKRSLKKYNISNPRKELAEALEKWTAEGVGSQPFHGGQNPDKADLAVFGVFRSIEGNYATWSDMQKNVGGKFWEWYGRMKSQMSDPVLN